MEQMYSKESIFKIHYWLGAEVEGKYRMPVLKPNNYIPRNVYSFTERSTVKRPGSYWLDFFVDDIRFECLWNCPQRYFKQLRNFEGIIAPDFSLLPDMPVGQIIWNCTRSRIMTYYLQQHGFSVIPVASWSCTEDFDWCFDGLPKNSSIALTANGCKKSSYAKRTFLAGIDALQKTKKPSAIIICGKHIDELEKYDNIIYYPNLSQRWKERVA